MQTDFPENLAPDRFVFWTPPIHATVSVGPERQQILLPELPLPIHCADATADTPSDAAIGQGVYDYLRQFPDCMGASMYAGLLRDAYPHFISDLAAQAVMIDAKQVESAYVLRKLNSLKILRLLEPDNRGLLLQLCRGFFELALEFAELAKCRRHLHEAMRFGQDLLKCDPGDVQALSLLAEIDLFFGDFPAATNKWRKISRLLDDPSIDEKISEKISSCINLHDSELTLVDDLETLARAMHLHAIGDDRQAVIVLDGLASAGRLASMLPPCADFYWLQGICRQGCGDHEGAMTALHKALEIDPEHSATLQTLASW